MKQITKKRFRQWIYESRGEAIRWVQQHGDEGVESVIQEACIKDLAYHEQCADSLDWYMAELIRSTTIPERYTVHLLNRFETSKRKDKRKYVVGILSELGRLGHQTVHDYVNSNWRKKLLTGNPELAASHVVIGGVKAYREVFGFLASQRIPKIKSDSDTWPITSVLFERTKYENIERIHDDLRIRFPQLKPLLHVWQPKKPKPDPATFQNLTIEQIRSLALSKDWMELSQWRSFALKEDWVRAAGILELDLDTPEAIRWLKVYRRRTFRGNIQSLLKWVENEETRHYALAALGQVKHPLARQTALQWIGDDIFYQSAIEVFEKNYEIGDEELLFEVVKNRMSEAPEDGDFIFLRRVAESNPGRQWNKFMRFAFNHNPCQVCRLSYAEYLNRHRLLTETEIDNLCYDGYHFTRKWARRLKKRRQRRLKDVSESIT